MLTLESLCNYLQDSLGHKAVMHGVFYSYVRLVVQITHERRKERIGQRTITIRVGVITTHLYRLTSGWHWPTNSGVPKMFLKSLPKLILWARPKSMSLMRGWGILRFNSMMFSGWERWEQRKNWRENTKERIRGTNDRCRTKTQQEWERDRERDREREKRKYAITHGNHMQS